MDELVQRLAERFRVVHDALPVIAACLVDDPPLKIKEGGLIRSGYSSELDDLNEISMSGRGWLWH